MIQHVQVTQIPEENNIFQYSALNKIANVLEQSESYSGMNAQIEDQPPIPDPKRKKEQDKDETSELKPKKLKMKEIVYQLWEQDEGTEKASFEEYLRFTKNHKLPALLVDIFIYLGAKKYVKHVIEPEMKTLAKTMDSEVATLLTKQDPILKANNQKVADELSNWRIFIGESKVEEYWKAFRKLAVDPMKTDTEIVATLDSIKQNFKKVFGVENDFLAKWIYYYLTWGYLDKEVRLPDFISKFLGYSTCLKKDLYKFIFNFLDVNRDEQVTIIDLIFFYTYMPKNTQFGTEIADAIELYQSKLIYGK